MKLFGEKLLGLRVKGTGLSLGGEGRGYIEVVSFNLGALKVNLGPFSGWDLTLGGFNLQVLNIPGLSFIKLWIMEG